MALRGGRRGVLRPKAAEIGSNLAHVEPSRGRFERILRSPTLSTDAVGAGAGELHAITSGEATAGAARRAFAFLRARMAQPHGQVLLLGVHGDAPAAAGQADLGHLLPQLLALEGCPVGAAAGRLCQAPASHPSPQDNKLGALAVLAVESQGTALGHTAVAVARIHRQADAARTSAAVPGRELLTLTVEAHRDLLLHAWA